MSINHLTYSGAQLKRSDNLSRATIVAKMYIVIHLNLNIVISYKLAEHLIAENYYKNLKKLLRWK